MTPDRLQIDYDLTFQTPFHCGTGIRIGLIDRSIVRDREGFLYVPGSTFKGVVREQCERLARLYAGTNEHKRAMIVSPHKMQEALRGLGKEVSMVTRIFGSPMYPGPLCFDDARQREDEQAQYAGQGEHAEADRYQNVQVDIATQVRLDRITRTAVEGALYTSEFGARNLVFHGSIVGSLQCQPLSTSTDAFFGTLAQVPTYSLLLLLAGLRMVERLGGNKSAGKGQCECEITSVSINNRQQPHWQDWLEHLEALKDYPLVQDVQEDV